MGSFSEPLAISSSPSSSSSASSVPFEHHNHLGAQLDALANYAQAFTTPEHPFLREVSHLHDRMNPAHSRESYVACINIHMKGLRTVSRKHVCKYENPDIYSSTRKRKRSVPIFFSVGELFVSKNRPRLQRKIFSCLNGECFHLVPCAEALHANTHHGITFLPLHLQVREKTLQSLPGRSHMLSGVVQAQLLSMLVAISGAQKVLEIGVCPSSRACTFQCGWTWQASPVLIVTATWSGQQCTVFQSHLP